MIIDFGNDKKGGSGSATIRSLTVNTNGVYTLTEGVDGYAPVTVEVPEKKLQEKTVSYTQNGVNEVMPDPGFDGVSKTTVTIDVPEPVLVSLNANENKTYNPQEGEDGFSSVVVNVPAPEIKLQEKSVTVNGPVTPDQGFDGLSKVDVNVAGGGGSIDLTGTGWEDKTFFPLYVPRASNLADDLDYTRTKKSEWDTDPNRHFADNLYKDDLNLIYAPHIKTVNVADMTSMYDGCSNLVAIPSLRTPNVDRLDYCFRGCEKLRSLPQLDTYRVRQATQMLVGCKALEEVGGFKDIKVDLNLSWCPLLNYQSLLNIIDHLADLTGQAQSTIILHPTSFNQLGQKQIRNIEQKNWSILVETDSYNY